jgi:hypothetical protein
MEDGLIKDLDSHVNIEARTLGARFDEPPGCEGLQSNEGLDFLNILRILARCDDGRLGTQAPAGQPDDHVLGVRATAEIDDGSRDVATLELANADDATGPSSGSATVTWVVADDVIAGVVEGALVLDEIYLESTKFVEALEMARVAWAVAGHGMVLIGKKSVWCPVQLKESRLDGLTYHDDEFLGSLAWYEPAIESDAIEGWEPDIFVLEALLWRVTENGRTFSVSE